MSVTDLFIRRPVMTILVSLGLLFFGIAAYRFLPVSYLPAVDYPTIQVNASLPGASASTMASNVASPLEQEFSAIAGLDSMSSANYQGLTQITLQFALDRSIDDAAMDVQAAIAKAQGSLPDGMPSPPYYSKVNPADDPIIYLQIYSDSMPLSRVNEYARTFVTQSLSMVRGVAQVLVYGEQKYAVRVKLDPNKLASRQITISEVKTAVQASNVNLPVGDLEGRYRNFTIDSDGQLMTAEPYNDVVIAYRNGQPVRLSDVGQAMDGVENDRTGCWFNGRRVIFLAVKRQPGSNTIDIASQVTKKLDEIRRQLPAAIELQVVYDASKTIVESVDDVKFTLSLAVGLVVLVVFLFLRSLSGTFISSVAVPFSIVATFAAMYLLGFTIDTLSLMALTLSVGFVVDDAIVMLENIVRHMEMGKKPFRAALEGAREVGFTIISMTLSLAVVFIPVLFMAGIIGRVMHEFALTIMIAILVSGAISLSLTPMLSSRVLRSGSKLAENDPIFGLMRRIYGATLKWALRHRLLTMLAAGALLAVTIHFFLIIPKGFQPRDDQGFIVGFSEAAQGISYESMAAHQAMLTPIIRSHPAVKSVFEVVGLNAQNQGLFGIMLKSLDERKESAYQVLMELWPKVNVIPGLAVFLKVPDAIPIGGKMTKSEYVFTLLAPDTDLLYSQARMFQTELAKLPQISGVNSDMQLQTPRVNVVIDRDKAAALGVSAEAVEDALYTAYGSRRISTIYAQNDEYKVIMELGSQFQQDPDDMSLLYVRSQTGDLVKLDAVVKTTQDLGPLTVNHTGQLPSVTFSFNAAPGVSIGEATKVVEDLAAKKLDDSISTMFEGTASAFKESMTSLYGLLILAVVVIYIILGVLYENFLHPVTIISGLPSAALGGLLTLWAFGMELDLYGFVGLILLIGIVKKNAIMVVDFAIVAERAGHPALEAAYDGAMTRFRPIMMTTIAAIAGAAPIALGYGAGASARRPLGLVVVGGLLLSQVVTLYLTPVFYTYMDRLGNLNPAKRRARAIARGEIEPDQAEGAPAEEAPVG